MTDPATAYFFKKYYRNIIKWWFVVYNPDFRKIWPSKEEEETARQKELEEKRIAHEKELEELLPKNRKNPMTHIMPLPVLTPVYMGRSRWMTRPSQPWTKF